MVNIIYDLTDTFQICSIPGEKSKSPVTDCPEKLS